MSYLSQRSLKSLQLGQKTSGLCTTYGTMLRDPTGEAFASNVKAAVDGKETRSVEQFDSKAYAPINASLAAMDRPLGIPRQNEKFNPRGAREGGKSEFER